ncbi:aspartyl-phosphate phosphatase Spo0E family protein [Clostridium grantii]|uniref:Spo0E like sporulation regulatory protein n=1 Tax=Clostridium grantii DSM 8605 TaxID=1121316 RepID=A0A1M5SIK4_9CLOT|nr:aspartyl-phosphate phosphatase Spo0E family protein [Clostridium grantii]SHH38422.1 Spo0E like sporulation regulatory protein [Clostridium grantii DSM 8605]
MNDFLATDNVTYNKNNELIITLDDDSKENNPYLLMLDNKIHQLRKILDKMCLSNDKTLEYKEILETSQYLDTLIVEYMSCLKNKTCTQ